MSTNPSEVNELFLEDIEELYLKVGLKLGSVSAAPQDRKILINRAKTWLDKNKVKLAEILCNNDKVRQFMETDDKTKKKIDLALHISDLVSTVVGGVPALTVSVLLIREGLDTLCSD